MKNNWLKIQNLKCQNTNYYSSFASESTFIRILISKGCKESKILGQKMDIHEVQIGDFGVKFNRIGMFYSRTKVLKSKFEPFFNVFEAQFYQIWIQLWLKINFHFIHFRWFCYDFVMILLLGHTSPFVLYVHLLGHTYFSEKN